MVYMAEFECAIFLQTFLSINTGISGLSSISSMIQTLCGKELVVYKMGAAGKTICVRSMGKMLQPAQNVRLKELLDIEVSLIDLTKSRAEMIRCIRLN